MDQGGNRRTDTGPITGADGVQWAERLSSVEEMVDRPDLRNELARVRDRVRAMRTEFKQHAELPKWDLVQVQVLQPLNEIRRQVSEELARRDTKDPLVPIDRDPVPAKFSELVRRYYETLGKDD